jgi:hypothetical protein
MRRIPAPHPRTPLPFQGRGRGSGLRDPFASFRIIAAESTSRASALRRRGDLCLQHARRAFVGRNVCVVRILAVGGVVPLLPRGDETVFEVRVSDYGMS